MTYGASVGPKKGKLAPTIAQNRWKWGPPKYHEDQGPLHRREPVWLVWRIEMWAQMPRNERGRRIDRQWMGRRCGPWLHYDDTWSSTWAGIEDAVDQRRTCGQYSRIAYFVEEWAWSAHWGWEPCDQI